MSVRFRNHHCDIDAEILELVQQNQCRVAFVYENQLGNLKLQPVCRQA